MIVDQPDQRTNADVPPLIGYAAPGSDAGAFEDKAHPAATAALAAGLLVLVVPVATLIVANTTDMNESILFTGLFLAFALAVTAVTAGVVAARGDGRWNRRTRRKATWGAIVAIIGLIFGGIVLVLPSLGRAREPSARNKCMSNLRSIGQAIVLCASENQGSFPDTIEGMIPLEDLSPNVLVCPNGPETPAVLGTTTQQTADNFALGKHVSFVYLGKGQSTAVPRNFVLAYEPPGHHRRGGGSSTEGAHVLFGDGHVTFVPAAVVKVMVQQLNAAQNPPPATAGY